MLSRFVALSISLTCKVSLLQGFAENLTWSFPPRGYPQQITREGFKAHQQGGYNGTLAWSAEVRAMHSAGNVMVVHICDNYVMRNGRMCNWPVRPSLAPHLM